MDRFAAIRGLHQAPHIQKPSSNLVVLPQNYILKRGWIFFLVRKVFPNDVTFPPSYAKCALYLAKMSNLSADAGAFKRRMKRIYDAWKVLVIHYEICLKECMWSQWKCYTCMLGGESQTQTQRATPGPGPGEKPSCHAVACACQHKTGNSQQACLCIGIAAMTMITRDYLSNNQIDLCVL